MVVGWDKRAHLMDYNVNCCTHAGCRSTHFCARELEDVEVPPFEFVAVYDKLRSFQN